MTARLFTLLVGYWWRWRKHIRGDVCLSDGDVIQVVLSRRFETEISVNSFDLYRMLGIMNLSPYMFHMAMDGLDGVALRRS